MQRASRILTIGAAVHFAIAVACVAFLSAGIPMIKPLKFAVSIGIFLATMAFLLPSLSLGPRAKISIASILVLTMAVEMVPITVQAWKGQLSHFNLSPGVGLWLWSLMIGAIVLLTLTMLVVAIVATIRPLGEDGLLAAAWRYGLWIFLLAAVSGFGMGGILQHSVGGADGGAGLPLLAWSTEHGDLRAPHFFALHALQVLPALALLLRALPLSPRIRWAGLWIVSAAYAALCLFILGQAFAGRPLI